MTANKWRETIVEKCKAVGTYKPAFDPVIDSLASVLAQRDKTQKEFKKSGGASVIYYVNKAGAKNMVKNPLLVLWDELNKSALAYWRDLGLTPAGLKKLDENALKKPKGSALAEALNKLGS
ncbi:MAG: P27 family phage terminase small subunit [Oscillospiraceae bacterium]|nr:P27 family phage terminase small subunit [Oscillospiraceae bacterium]